MSAGGHRVLTPLELRIVRLWREGKTARQVALELADGRTRGSVMGILFRLREAGVEVDAPPGTPVPFEPEPPPAPPPEPLSVVDKPGEPPWRCKADRCSGVVQPGRDHCATCISRALAMRREAGHAA